MWFLLFFGCSPDTDPCVEMCQSAAALYGACLDDWGLEWSAAGYADAVDFVDGCETWAWEMRLLEDGATEPGRLDDTCVEREVRFSADDADCSEYTAVDWSEVP